MLIAVAFIQKELVVGHGTNTHTFVWIRQKLKQCLSAMEDKMLFTIVKYSLFDLYFKHF
jgi:hypothetical protein